MNNKLVSVTITATVILILTASVVVPVIADAEEGQKVTYTNAGLPAKLLDDEDYTYSWDSSTHLITIGTDSIPLSGITRTMILTDSGYLRANAADNQVLGYYIDSDDIIRALANVTAFTVTVDGSAKSVSITGTMNGSPLSVSWTYSDWCLVPALNGDYVMFVPSAIDSPLYSSASASIYSIFHSGGTWVLSLDTTTESRHTPNTPDYTVKASSTSVADVNNLDRYLIGTTATAQYGVETSGTFTAPDAVAFEKSATGYKDSGESIISLLHIIPIFLILATIIGLVGFVAVKRN